MKTAYSKIQKWKSENYAHNSKQKIFSTISIIQYAV